MVKIMNQFKTLLLTTAIFIGSFLLLSGFAKGYTETRSGARISRSKDLYDTVVRTDSTTICTGSGWTSCGRESWQHLTESTTLDGKSIDWVNVLKEVKADMLNSKVPDRGDEPVPVSFEWQYSGTVTVTEHYKPTNEMIIRTADWKAITLKDFTYTVKIQVIPYDSLNEK